MLGQLLGMHEAKTGSRLVHIEDTPGSPSESGYCERFNGKDGRRLSQTYSEVAAMRGRPDRFGVASAGAADTVAPPTGPTLACEPTHGQRPIPSVTP